MNFYTSILISIFLILSISANAQYGNKFIIGLSSAGFYSTGGDERAFNVELYPSIGFRVYDSLYVFVEGGTSFGNSSDNIKPPKLWSLGILTRMYVHRYKFLDFYGALSAKLSNISYPIANERFNPIQNRGLTNSIFGVYGGINIKLYKGLSGSLEYGVRYYETLGFGRHNNLVLQIAI